MKATPMAAFALAASLSAACTWQPAPPSQDWALVAQKAETAEDHEQLAKHYDEIARTMQAKADEERQLLAEFQRRPSRYGRPYTRRIPDLRSRSTALVHDFEASARDSRRMADFHRQMASELH